MENLEQRIIELESKFCFQNETIESLNQVVIDQQKEIQQLNSKIEQIIQFLKSSLSSNSADVVQNPLDESLPPHY